MIPSEFATYVRSLTGAAEIVEAIDTPSLQDQRGWDLSRWRYDLIPWGVRFRFHRQEDQAPAELLVIAGFDGEGTVATLLEAGQVVARASETGAVPGGGR